MRKTSFQMSHFTQVEKTNYMSYHKSFKKNDFNFLTKYLFFFHFKQVHWQLGTIQYSEIQWQRMTRWIESRVEESNCHSYAVTNSCGIQITKQKHIASWRRKKLKFAEIRAILRREAHWKYATFLRRRVSLLADPLDNNLISRDLRDVFSRGHATLHLAVSVRPSVGP